ncbi:MAG: 1-(5-phosphoribosyl)-5-[(5-phosphoribosylamino)methylideneamino]imidazole-4-carboxamide isomerase [Candidatus Omnitrophota bacterium]|nr:MAG: 1-(5-phosphoribosyl)-5-[(5-phosphoribosylamino)methylideneamino]imidazole-4-carboxamide isomerase [Candidatus Omnitrophota bacterium]
MLIIPAIDLKDGKVVRLVQGEYGQKKVYSDSAVSVAKQWEAQGAEIIHIVDLDGAVRGGLKNIAVVQEVKANLSVKVHFGGGVRSVDDLKILFDAGVHKVIIGTKIFSSHNFLQEIVRYDKLLLKRIIVSIDAKSSDKKNYFVQHTGWTKSTALTAVEALKQMRDTGIEMAVVTDIMQDGMLSGPNFVFIEKVLKNSCLQIIASGGITDLADIKKLNDLSLKYKHLYGAIIGKALYEGKINLKEAISNAKQT